MTAFELPTCNSEHRAGRDVQVYISLDSIANTDTIHTSYFQSRDKNKTQQNNYGDEFCIIFI